MAQVVPPVTEVTPKLSKAQAALIQAEKQKDNQTREQLEKLYGAAQGPRLRRVHFTRFADKTWKCPACGAMSRDIRYVCGRCLAPEPNAVSKDRPYKERAPRRRGVGAEAATGPTTTATPPLMPPQWLEPRGPAESRDRGVQLLTIPATQRVYRQWQDPIAPAAKVPKTGHGEGQEAHYDPNDDDVDEEDEAIEAGEAGRQERLYADVPEGCAPGARFRDMADPRRGDEVDEGEGEEASGVGVIGDTRPAGNPHSTQPQKRVLPEKPFTHFVALPIGKLPGAKASCERLVGQLQQFARSTKTTDEVSTRNEEEEKQQQQQHASLSSPSASLADEMVSPVSKLHFTLLLLTLSTPEDVAFATELLHHFETLWADTKKKLIEMSKHADVIAAAQASSEAAKIRLSTDAPHQPEVLLGAGLHVMPTGKSNEVVNVKKAGVVYMSPRDDASKAAIVTIQELLHTCFREIIDRPDEAEKSKQLLHMTVVNKKWRRKAAKRPFDATELLRVFHDAVIGQDESGTTPFTLGCVELNRMSGGNHDDGYVVEASVNL